MTGHRDQRLELSVPELRAVGFDAAETLFYNRALAARLADLNRSGDPNLRAQTLERALRRVGGRGLWPEDSPTATLRLERWSAFYRLVFAEAGLTTGEAKTLGDQCGALIVDPLSYAVFDDVHSTLARLAELSVRTCVISNFDPLLRQILDHLELHDRFSLVVTSSDVGSYKPDPHIFEVALRRLGLPPRSMAYIGDSLLTDVGGAQAAGLVPVLLDRNGRHRSFPGHRVASLGELLALFGDNP